jgi:hypothetical protein
MTPREVRVSSAPMSQLHAQNQSLVGEFIEFFKLWCVDGILHSEWISGLHVY